MELDVVTPQAFNVRAVPTNAVSVNTSGAAVILVPVPGGQGVPGASGGTVQAIAAAVLSGHRVVTPLNDGTVDYADATNTAHASRPMLLTTSAWNRGDLATLIFAGPVTEPSWNWTPGLPIYLGADGVLAQTVDLAAVFTLIVAEVINATTIEFRPQSPIITA